MFGVVIFCSCLHCVGDGVRFLTPLRIGHKRLNMLLFAEIAKLSLCCMEDAKMFIISTWTEAEKDSSSLTSRTRYPINANVTNHRDLLLVIFIGRFGHL